MDIELNETEARVLGCLIEKDMGTPEYYPLSLNGLQNACNQKSNRNPVVSYDEQTVVLALDGLKEKRLAWQSDVGRVPKYAHQVEKKFNLVARESAIICLLLLRGPQTVGELRGRSGRLYAFRELSEVVETLQSLKEMGLVKKMPRQPGRKEFRYAHLLSGEPEMPEGGGAAVTENATIQVRADNERVAALEKEVELLRGALEELKQSFIDFKGQFE